MEKIWFEKDNVQYNTYYYFKQIEDKGVADVKAFINISEPSVSGWWLWLQTSTASGYNSQENTKLIFQRAEPSWSRVTNILKLTEIRDFASLETSLQLIFFLPESQPL